jgi:hypothetical protein
MENQSGGTKAGTSLSDVSDFSKSSSSSSSSLEMSAI